MSSAVVAPPSPVLLDTCAAIWIMGGDPLSTRSQEVLLSARSAGSGIYVSPFSIWEIGTQVAKGRTQIAMPPEKWFATLLSFPGFRLAPLTPEILLSSTALPGTPPNDPADRIIAATARSHGFVLITRDRLLLAYAQQGYLQAIAC